jgi:hypothetical protein
MAFHDGGSVVSDNFAERFDVGVFVHTLGKMLWILTNGIVDDFFKPFDCFGRYFDNVEEVGVLFVYTGA